jgi:hypothetical protein
MAMMSTMPDVHGGAKRPPSPEATLVEALKRTMSLVRTDEFDQNQTFVEISAPLDRGEPFNRTA